MADLPLRKIILWGALALTLLAVILIDEEPDELSREDTVEAVLPTRNVDRRARVANSASNQSLPVDQLGKRSFKAQADDIFSSSSWRPVPVTTRRGVGGEGGGEEEEEDENDPFSAARKASRQASAPAPAPVAPPLQIKYLGRVSDGRVTRVFLLHQDKNYAPKVGERIEGLYRLDKIQDDTLELTYLPLGIKQKLDINEKSPGKT